MMDRYARQVVLPEVGAVGQARIAASNVLVVGAGGLGCAVLQYLCAAGIGRIVIVDHDQVDETNLHRQPLYRTRDCGQPKVEVARRTLRELNPGVRIDSICERLTPANACELVQDTGIVVDCADSFAVTYILSDECSSLGKPLVSASVLGLSGYVGAFCGGAPSYRAVFPDIPGQAGSCATAGVLGSAVGVMGTLQAQMVLSMVLGLQPSVSGRLVSVDFRTWRFGGFSFASAPQSGHSELRFMAPRDVAATDVIVDLRSTDEAPLAPFPTALRIGVDEIEGIADSTPASQRIVLCCRTGVRAWRAARALQQRGHANISLIALGE